MKEATIVCFGDSITYGYCADYGTDYVSLLRKQQRGFSTDGHNRKKQR